MQPVKRLEDFLPIYGIDADDVIQHRDLDVPIATFRCNPHARRTVAERESRSRTSAYVVILRIGSSRS